MSEGAYTQGFQRGICPLFLPPPAEVGRALLLYVGDLLYSGEAVEGLPLLCGCLAP